MEKKADKRLNDPEIQMRAKAWQRIRDEEARVAQMANALLQRAVGPAVAPSSSSTDASGYGPFPYQ